MKNIILKLTPTYLMTLLLSITLALTFSVDLISIKHITFICLYLVGVISAIFIGVVLGKYFKEVK